MQQCDETIHESEPAVTCKKDSTPILPSCCCESRLAEDQGLTSCCRRRSSTSAASGVAFAAGPTLWKTPARPTPASIADSDPCIAHSGSVCDRQAIGIWGTCLTACFSAQNSVSVCVRMRDAYQVPGFCQWRLLGNSILTAVLLARLRLGRPCREANLQEMATHIAMLMRLSQDACC